jgi:nucleoside-diphosphate-sugar epimerase
MNILVCGANGFIGRHLYKALEQAGHHCIAGVRKITRDDQIAIDYTRDIEESTWLPRLAGVDAVVNAIGILRDTRGQPMTRIHAETPIALFQACRTAGVKKVIHISALGVGSGLATQYFSTKQQAEAALVANEEQLDYLILRPSVVYGSEGASARMFRLQARLPVHTLPMGGHQMLQPVHVDDLAAACVRWLENNEASKVVAAVGSDAVNMRAMLDSYRQQMGYGKALHVPVPGLLVKLAAKCGDWVPVSPLSTDNLLMLNAGSTADKTAFARLLGREPRSVHTFLQAEATNNQTSAK